MIPQTDPKAGYAAYAAEIDAAIKTMLESGWYILGKEVSTFEAAFANYIGTSHAVGVANGTDAITLALKACDVGPGDTVLTVSHTAVATVVGVELTGATPVLLDIDPTSYCLDSTLLKAALDALPTPPKAIVAVHLYGHPANLDVLLPFCAEHDILLIEDCAQAHGATWNGQRVGSFGAAASFSLYPTKNLGALGDGGIITTNTEAIATAIKELRQYGWRQRYISDIKGVNSRLDELQAAILNVKLTYLDAENSKRQQLANIYSTRLGSIAALKLPQTQPQATHVYHQYVIQVESATVRQALMAYLKEHGVATGIHYPVPVHKQPAYTELTTIPKRLTVTEQAALKIVSLPMYPQLTPENAELVCNRVLQFFETQI